MRRTSGEEGQRVCVRDRVCVCVIVCVCVCNRVCVCVCLEPATELGKENFWVDGQPESECVCVLWGQCGVEKRPCRRAAQTGESAPEQRQERCPGMGCPSPSRM